MCNEYSNYLEIVSQEDGISVAVRRRNRCPSEESLERRIGMELNKQNMIRIFKIAAGIILFYVGLQNLSAVMGRLRWYMGYSRLL